MEAGKAKTKGTEDFMPFEICVLGSQMVLSFFSLT
jgi:hypothetical protein